MGVYIASYSAADGQLEEFEQLVQEFARCLYEFKYGITDVRVCHPRRGDVVFILTFLSTEDLELFKWNPAGCMQSRIKSVVKNGEPKFLESGCLMPSCHTLTSLLKYLEKNVVGSSHNSHDVPSVLKELRRWFPRRKEYEQYIHWDENDPKKYTRNIIFSNEHFDALLMCWPPHCESSIHCHSNSSCWVTLIEGEVVEVLYAMPKCDLAFLEAEPGTVGRCGKLKPISESKLCFEGGATTTYASNEVGIHKVCNRTDFPAMTLHVYAPGLRSMMIFKESGQVSAMTMTAPPLMSVDGRKAGTWNSLTHPDGILDVESWNKGMIV